MTNILCKSTTQRETWAIGLCFASALLMSLEALHGKACLWLGLNLDQTYSLSALLATASVFLGAFIFARLVVKK